MFLAVDLREDDDDSMIGIETTMMGNDDLGHFDKLKKISDERRNELKNQASFKTFEAAVDVGTQALEDDAKHFEDEEDLDYQLIDLAAAREDYIMPIGYTPAR